MSKGLVSKLFISRDLREMRQKSHKDHFRWSLRTFRIVVTCVVVVVVVFFGKVSLAISRFACLVDLDLKSHVALS